MMLGLYGLITQYVFRYFYAWLYISAGCSTYGDTYEVHTNMYLSGNNMEETMGTLQFCMDFCSSKSDCRSFEHVERDAGLCLISVATALTHPGSYLPQNNCNYYNRNCA